MNIITQPYVEIVGVTHFLGHTRYKIPSDGSDAAKLCAFAAKGCYDSFGETGRSNADNQVQVVEQKHGSVLEHFNITLFIEGITRGCSHEIVRHRAGFGYSQRSTRYTEESDAAIVLEPYYADIYQRWQDRRLDPGSDEYQIVYSHLARAEVALDQYRSEVRMLMEQNPLDLAGTPLRKWARGKARNILPHALETRMTITGNIRAWRHFMGMRSAPDAEAEIRRLSAAIMPFLLLAAPEHFSDFTASEGVDGITSWTPGVWKV